MNAPFRPRELTRPVAVDTSPASTRDLLRFLTCGSVDDGKSTLIGRLLFEAGAVPDDQLATLDRDSNRHGTTGGRDFALLVDGLAAEREQGITIDVAYRYFSTSHRSFIVADTPGHEHYTRNMATGASTADLAIILIDASKGVLPQTRRHAYIAAMLGIRKVVLAVNKMDLVGFEASRFTAIEREAKLALSSLAFDDVIAIPLAARSGEGIAAPSAAMPWYSGPNLLQHLEQVEIARAKTDDFRFPVQWVNRPDANFRGYSGFVSSGSLRLGDRVKILPSGRDAQVTRIVTPTGDAETVSTGAVPTLVLDREIDISRGDVIVSAQDPITASGHLNARLLWMAETPFDPARRLKLKLGSSQASLRGMIVSTLIDIEQFQPRQGPLTMNAIAEVSLTLDRAIISTNHADDRNLGRFILIDAITGATVALGIVEKKPALSSGKPGLFRRLRDALRPASGEQPARSLVKAITWRITGSLDTFLLSWLFTQSAKLAAAISVSEILTKLFLYYWHERAWARSSFGLAKRQA